MSETSNVLKHIEQKQKNVRSNYLNEINESLFQAKLKNNGRLPHGISHDVDVSSKPNFVMLLIITVNGTSHEKRLKIVNK